VACTNWFEHIFLIVPSDDIRSPQLDISLVFTREIVSVISTSVNVGETILFDKQ